MMQIYSDDGICMLLFIVREAPWGVPFEIKMKELELEQFMLSKEKEERVPLVLPSNTK